MNNSYSEVGEEEEQQHLTMKEPPLSLFASVVGVFLPSFLVFVLLDALFITFVAGPMFKAALGDIIRPVPNLVSGILAWVVIVSAVYFQGLSRAKGSMSALAQGALVGFFLYGTYELTQHSVISTWSWPLVLTDMTWGSFACALTCGLMHSLSKWLSHQH